MRPFRKNIEIKKLLLLELKGTVSQDFLLLVFFTKPSSPKPLIKALRYICKSMCTTGVNNTSGKLWEHYQTAGTLKWAWRKKLVISWPCYSKVLKPKFKNFLIKDFFDFATGVNDNFRKNSNRSQWDTLGLGETDSWKNLKSKMSWQCPFNLRVWAQRAFIFT